MLMLKLIFFIKLSYKGKILVTGSAGFIGFHPCKRLIYEGIETIGFDSINNYDVY